MESQDYGSLAIEIIKKIKSQCYLKRIYRLAKFLYVHGAGE